MIATIAVIVAIAEKKKVQWSYENHSPAIAATTSAETELFVSAIFVAAIAGEWFPMIAMIAAIAGDFYFLSDRSDHSDGSDHMKTGL